MVIDDQGAGMEKEHFRRRGKQAFTDTRKSRYEQNHRLLVILFPLQVCDLEGQMIQIHIIYIFVYLQVYSRS